MLFAALNDAASAVPPATALVCSHSGVANSDVGQILEDVSEEKRHKPMCVIAGCSIPGLWPMGDTICKSESTTQSLLSVVLL